MSGSLPLHSWCSWNWQGKLFALVKTEPVNSKRLRFRSGSRFFVFDLFFVKLQTMSVLAVMRNLRSEVDAGSIRPYCFVEINGLKLASPENIYRVRYKLNSCMFLRLKIVFAP